MHFMKRAGIKAAQLALAVVIATTAVAGLSTPAKAAPNVISISFTQEPDSLNPMYSTQYFSGLARSLILLSAWDYDDKLNLVPVLAAEIPSLENGGVSADGKTITIKLRDTKWSDGVAVTSADFAFTAAMYKSEKNAPLGRGVFGDDIVASVETPDALTVVVNFNEPYAAWPASLFGTILPAHILGPVFDADGTLDKADWNIMPTVVNGPFVLKEYQRGQFMLFERNPEYSLTPAKLEEILIKFVPDDAAQVAAVKAGDSDIAVFLGSADAQDLQASAPVNIVTVASGYNEGWFFNLDSATGNPALQDERVRKAISLSVDRAELIDGLLYNLVAPARSFWDQSPFQSPELADPVFDPEAARALLDEAGWVAAADGMRSKDGVALKIRYATNQRGLRKDAQRVIEGYLNNIGIAVELINYDNQIFLASYEKEGPIARGQYDVAQWAASSSFPDPNTRRFLASEIPTAENGYVGSNWGRVNDTELDALLQAQRSTVDVAARTAIFHQISAIVTERVYWMPLWQDPDIWAVNQRLTGVRFSGGSPWWNVTEWEAK
jgi:peptide/nickel transport system substrate-binding protein